MNLMQVMLPKGQQEKTNDDKEAISAHRQSHHARPHHAPHKFLTPTPGLQPLASWSPPLAIPCQRLSYQVNSNMNIIVNEKETALQGSTVADLVAQLGLPPNGVAVAIGMDIVPRVEWAQKALAEGDKVMIIKAASGG